MKTRHAVLFMMALLVSMTGVRAAADITGKWTATFDTPIGQQSYTYEFVVKDGKLTGTASGNMGQSAISDGKVDGDVVTFVEMLDGQIRVDYTGKIASDDEIQFSRKVGDFGTEELVAKRVKADKAARPGPQ